MTTSFPTALDTFSNPSASDATNNLTTPHAAQHANANDAIEAIEAKIGTGASTPLVNRLLRGTGTGTSAWAQVAAGDYAAGSIALADLASSLYTDTSYTPSLAGDSTAGSHTYSQRAGNYIRIGGFVVAWFNVALSAKDGTTAGAMYISLPLTSRNTSNLIGAGFIYAYGNVDFDAGRTHLNGYVLPNDNKMYFSQAGDNVAGANVLAAAISNSTIIRGCAIYPI